ncbi:MAG: hypothetical protein Q9191_007929, partial [Dirinaria sp. TL-2023a]
PDLALPAKILPPNLPANNHSTPLFFTSDLPSQEYLTQSSASSTRSSSSFTATIPPYDSSSFVTDLPQTWLTQPNPTRLPTPASTAQPTTTTPDSATDFVLFPSSSAHNPSERAPATSRTDRNFSPGSAFTGQHLGQSCRRNSTQPSNSASPMSERRVSNQFQRSSSVTSSNGIHSGLHSLNRPPVPLFANNSPSSINQLPQKPTLSAADPQGKLKDYSNPSPELTTHLVMDYYLDHSQMDCSPSFAQHSDYDHAHEQDIVSPGFNVLNYKSALIPNSNSFETISTVSPTEIMSAPPSAVTTNLTTPDFGFDDSPFGAFSTDTSPVWINDDATLPQSDLGVDNGVLFPDLPSLGDTFAQAHAQSTGQSPTPTSPARPVAPPMSRKASSTKMSRDSNLSSTSGITKRKSRTEPLPPIVVEDPNDTVAVKRARNTAAARKSRKKREQHMNDLEAENEKLKEEVEYWKNQAISKQPGA